MHLWKTAGALTLTGLLALPLAAPAEAAGSFTDLSPSHWAYASMMEAVDYGILQGGGDGKLNPSGTLSWGQYLVMLARTFAAGDYEAALASGQSWDQAGYSAALAAGLLREEDGLPADRLDEAITRQDAAVLLANALPEENHHWSWSEPLNPASLTDWGRMDALHQAAVAALAERSILNGKADGSFGYADTIQRADGTALLMRVLEQVDESRDGQEVWITLHFVDTSTGAAVLPDQQMGAAVNTYLSSLTSGLELGYYTYDYSATAGRVSTACDEYTILLTPMTQAEIQESQFWERVERGEAAYEDYYLQDFWLTFQGDNYRKHLLLFGDETKSRFANREEAAAGMTTVTVPVWKLSGGTKTASSLSLSVHAAIAEDVTAIFTEIYNDPEQFPIHDVGGYAWRGDTATGEHNCGTAIDINANENYQIRDGQVLAGASWEPGTNPHSIAPGSSVVRIFAEHGWSWGGDAWAYSSDASQGYHDYMHFSYMGG